ncbi:hypothetical protein MTO96_001899 [Rhipicephalus appendiculatus]
MRRGAPVTRPAAALAQRCERGLFERSGRGRPFFAVVGALRIGLDYVVEHPEYTRTLATAAASGNSDLRRQVWELLVALCVRGGEGTRRALSTLDQLATLRAQRTRLAALALAISRGTDDEVPPLLALANKALSGRDRARLRAELRARGSKVLTSPPPEESGWPSGTSGPPETLQQAWTALSTRASGSGKREAYLLRALQRLLADDAWDTPVRQTKHSQTSLEALDRCGTGTRSRRCRSREGSRHDITRCHANQHPDHCHRFRIAR